MSKFDKELIEKGTKAIIDFYQTMAIDKCKHAGLDAFVTGIDSPFLNVVIDTSSDDAISSEIIISLENFFNSHSVPWGWFITALAKTDNLENLDFYLLEEVPGMYLNLLNPLPNISTNDISIKELETNDNLLQWIQPIREGFPSNDQGEAYRKLNENLLQKGEKKLRQFVAYHKNQIAASATLFLSDDAIMLHNLATKLSFKKLGIGRTLTIYMMKEAQKMGYQDCFLDSSEEGFNLYRKLGFKVYCTTKIYAKKT